jgi:hypothetical protein
MALPFNEARRPWIIVENLAELTDGAFEGASPKNGSGQTASIKFPVFCLLVGLATGTRCPSPDERDRRLPVFTAHLNYQTLPKFYGKFMTYNTCSDYSPPDGVQ